ncbi:MAG: RidA family protein [Actinobacteria bacterium]|jgi:2-iminobutanoate/2-iminopropanoate deaminase|nr:RidA family protein [Actinomycetota bacterium]
MPIQHFGARPERALTPAVRAGDWLFVSGQAATDPETGAVVPGSFADEFDLAFANLTRVLHDAGADLSQVVRVLAFVSDEAWLGQYNERYLAAFPHPRPARTTFVSPLTLVKVELECQAYLGP